MPRSNNYSSDTPYDRRIRRGLALGLSVSQARGHPRLGEPAASSPAAKPKSDERIEAAIRDMRSGTSMTAAAKAQRISPKRLSRFLKAHSIARYRKRKWFYSDTRTRRVPVLEGDRQKTILVPGYKEASRVGAHRDAVGRFTRSGDITHLASFEGDGVTDIKGRFHPFETDPNAILRFAAKDEPAFHEIYQIVST